MSDDPTDELEALRVRAYGPDADIAGDPQALRRLRELEARALGAPEPEPIRHADDAPSAAAPDEPPAAAPTLAASWWERNRAFVWGGTLLIAALLGVAVGSAQLSPGREQVAVLREDDDGAWPELMWGTRPPDGVTFEEYFGLTAIASARDFGNGTNSTCLWVYDSASVNFGLSSGACAAGSAPVSPTIAVTAQAPAALLEEFREGTILQFVLDGDRVLVYAERP